MGVDKRGGGNSMWGTEASVIRFVRPTDPALLFFPPPHFAAPRPIFFALYVVYVDTAKCVTLNSGGKNRQSPKAKITNIVLLCQTEPNKCCSG